MQETEKIIELIDNIICIGFGFGFIFFVIGLIIKDLWPTVRRLWYGMSKEKKFFIIWLFIIILEFLFPPRVLLNKHFIGFYPIWREVYYRVGYYDRYYTRIYTEIFAIELIVTIVMGIVLYKIFIEDY